MKQGVLEELVERLGKLEEGLKEAMEGKEYERKVASFTELAKMYCCARSSVRQYMYQLAAAGYVIDTYKVGSEWRVDVEQFDKAYRAHFERSFTNL